MVQSTEHADGEQYHVYNRGAHKQVVFTQPEDYSRFLMLLYLLNTKESIVVREILRKYRGQTSANIFLEERAPARLVEILAYTLMPNHFHLLLRQVCDKGITTFMRKVCTGYSMYFNTKHEHSGIIFQGRYKSSHIDNEPYFRYIFSYIHLNPLALTNSRDEKHGTLNPVSARNLLSNYKYSSYQDYAIGKRPERSIISFQNAPDFLTKQNDLEDLLKWQHQYPRAQELPEV